MITIAEMRRTPLAQAAQRLGLRVTRRGITPCPACGRAGRATSTYRSGEVDRWHCHRCDLGGDVIDLVAYRLGGVRYSSAVSEIVRGWFGDSVGFSSSSLGFIEPPPPRPPPPSPPPIAEVLGLLAVCHPASVDPEVAAWVDRRVRIAASLDGLVTALPARCDVPPWARYRGRPWSDIGYRAIVPVYDDRGQIGSVRARHIDSPDCPLAGRPKALPPAGFSLRGLVMANPAGRAMLRSGCRPDGWRPGWVYRVVVVEGEPAWMSWAAARPAIPVFGIASGSWTDAIAARVPDGALVVVVTDRDDAGSRYAARVVRSLVGRCTTTRWRDG